MQESPHSTEKMFFIVFKPVNSLSIRVYYLLSPNLSLLFLWHTLMLNSMFTQQPHCNTMGYFHRLQICYTPSTNPHNPHLVSLLTSPSMLLILTSSLRISKAPWIRSSRFIPFSLAKVSSKPFSASSYVCLGEKKKISDNAGTKPVEMKQYCQSRVTDVLNFPRVATNLNWVIKEV